MLMTRRGRHYPTPKWAEGRNKVVMDLAGLIPPTFVFDKPVSMEVIYTPADLKRRDMPAMLDSIFHIMEKVGLIADDCLVKDLQWTAKAKDKENAGVSVFLEDLP